MIVTAALALSLLGQTSTPYRIKAGSDPRPYYILIGGDPRVDVYARSAPVAKVLESIAKQSNRRLAWTSRPSLGVMTTAFINAPLSTVADRLFQPMDSGMWLALAVPYLVVDRPNEPVTKRVTFSAKDMEIRDVLRPLMKQADASYTLDRNLQGRVTLEAKDAPFLSTLKRILAPLGAGVVIEGGIYNIVIPGGDPVDLSGPVASFSLFGGDALFGFESLGTA